MVCINLQGRPCDLRSRMRACFVILLVFTLLMVLTQYTTTWTLLSPLSLVQYAPGSRIFRECRQLTENETIDWNNLYYIQDLSKKKSLIWCKVPKAGSTTLTRLFDRLAGATEVENDITMHAMLRKLYPLLSSEEMTRKLNTTFKFLVVRHPFERILSAYRDKLEDYNRDSQFRAIGQTMVKRPVNGAVVEPTFSEFVTYLTETSPETYNGHWRPISRHCAPCSIHYDAIVRRENFDKEIKVPLQQAGIYEDIGRARSTGTDRQGVERYFQKLSFTQMLKLYTIYRNDFNLFGYTPEKYFSMVLAKTAKVNFPLASTFQPDA